MLEAMHKRHPQNFDPSPLSTVVRIEPTPLPSGVRVDKARFITQSQDSSKSVLISPFLDVICMI